MTLRKAFHSASFKVSGKVTVVLLNTHIFQALERTSFEDDKPHPLSTHQPSQLGLPPRPQHAPSPQLLSSEPEPEDNAQTIKPNRSPGLNVVPLPVARAPRADISVILEDSTFNGNTSSSMGSTAGIESDTEDYSDLGLDEDEDKLQEKVKDFKVSIGMLFCLVQILKMI